jgi:acyl-CoA thioester hydrolase
MEPANTSSGPPAKRSGLTDPVTPVASTNIRVRYKDTDCMKVVYYGNYLTYFEVGRVEFLRQQGLAMSEVDQRVHLPVVEALVRFRKPARLDDLLEVRCWVSERKRASFRFAYEIRNETGEPVATGSTLHACLDPATSAMIAVPAWLRERMPIVPSN